MNDNQQQQELSLDLQPNYVMGSTKGAIKAAGGSSIDLWTIPVENIDEIRIIEDFNVRIKDESYFADIQRYADDMLATGYKKDKPLSGYISKENGVDVIYLTDGHRRLAALRLALSKGAKIDHVPILTATKSKSFEDLTVDLITNNDGTKLTPFEVAIVCKRLDNYGWSVEKIASRVHFEAPYITNLLYLMAAPKTIRDMVQNGKVSAGDAIELLRKHGNNAMSVIEAGLVQATVAGKAKLTKRFLPGAQYAKFVKKSAPAMVTALREVKSDPAFATLSEETRTKLDELLKTIVEAEDKDKVVEINDDKKE